MLERCGSLTFQTRNEMEAYPSNTYKLSTLTYVDRSRLGSSASVEVEGPRNCCRLEEYSLLFAMLLLALTRDEIMALGAAFIVHNYYSCVNSIHVNTN